MPRIAPIPWEELTPERRAAFEAGAAANAFKDRTSFQILAYTHHDAPPADGDRHPNYPHSLLPARLLEMVRIRSAQLGGCEPCSAARKIDAATDEVVACLIDPSLRGDIDERERLALELLERLSADHHGIDDAFYRRMAEHFTTAEIVELGQIAGTTMGMHRFLHTVRIYDDAPPVIAYDPSQVGVSTAQREERLREPAG